MQRKIYIFSINVENNDYGQLFKTPHFKNCYAKNLNTQLLYVEKGIN